MKLRLIILTVGIILSITSCKKDDPTPTPTDTMSTEGVFKFDNNLSDSTGKNTSPTTVGTVTYTTDHHGNANSALVLNGSTSVTFPAIHLKTNCTLAAWVKASGSTGTTYFITAINSVGFGLAQTGFQFGFAISLPGTSSATSNTLDVNWHHIAGTYNGTDIKIYVDGVLKATTNHPGVLLDANYPLVIGSFGGFFWTGTLDDVRVYTTVLSDAQIAALAAN